MTPRTKTSFPARLGRAIWPKEHGSWSLALEPVALGLLAAPSAAGAGIAVAAVAGMLLRRPIKLVADDRGKARRPAALGAVVALGLAAAAGLAVGGWIGGPARLWPLLLAVPPGLLFLWLDARGEARAAAAELAGAAAFALVPAAIATATGWPAARSLALAVAMGGRSLPTVVTIRTFLRRHKGQAVTPVPALAASVAAVLAVGLVAWEGLGPWMAVAVMALLLGRAVWLLGRPLAGVSATRIGIAESVIGGILVVVLALSWPG